MTTRIVDVRSANLLPEEATELRPFHTIQWVSVLKSMTAYQMYRRSEQVRVQRRCCASCSRVHQPRRLDPSSTPTSTTSRWPSASSMRRSRGPGSRRP
jgi:hypothetical protein